MGLDTSHDAWSGAYSAFHTWREMIVDAAGLPPLVLMEGFYQPLYCRGYSPPTLWYGLETMETKYMDDLDNFLPIKWECLKPSPLHELLCHSDCEGEIPADHCAAIADALEAVIPKLPDKDVGGHIGNVRKKTQRFVDGLRAAAEAGEPLDFH